VFSNFAPPPLGPEGIPVGVLAYSDSPQPGSSNNHIRVFRHAATKWCGALILLVGCFIGGSGIAAAATTEPQVTLSASSLSFGDVAVGSSSTQSFTITSTGSGAATVDSVTPSGTGFTVSGASFPLTLSTPGQAVKLTVQFKPTTAGVDSGRLTIISNSTHYPDTSVGINGTGTSAEQHQVDLNWSAPSSSPVPVSGYNILRATGGGKFQVMNSSVYEPTTYVDSTVQSATTYSYEVESVDSSGVTSSPSNEVTVTVP
jgi:hypothetical protein